MALIIKRLGELKKPELLALGAFLRDEIQPASISAGSDYVCQVDQKAHYWSDGYLAGLHKEASPALGIWAALDGGLPVATCWVVVGSPDRMITLFLVDEKLSDPEQLVTSDAIARRAVEEMMAEGFDGDLISMFPDNSKAAVYARLVGFKVDPERDGAVLSALKPKRWWRVKASKLLENILKRTAP